MFGNQKGFSLIELLSVMVLITMSVTLVIPSYQFFIRKQQTLVAINQLINAITFAKVSAIRYREMVTLCPSKSGQSCDENFTEGMIVFRDRDGKRQPTPENLLRVYAKVSSAGQMRWNRKDAYLQFSKTGFLQSKNGIFFYFPTAKDKKYSHQVIVSKTGRLRVVGNNAALY